MGLWRHNVKLVQSRDQNPHVVPADAKCELLSAGFDPVLSLHVCHELGAVAVDGQDGVAWAEVTLGGLAAWCDL